MKKWGLGLFLAAIVGLLFFLPFALSAQDKKEGEEAYNIKKGDTLWGISSQFLKNPFLWPKLWQRNPYITNPHWIYPGNPVRLNPIEEPKKQEPQTVAEEKPKEKAAEPEVKKVETPVEVKKTEPVAEKVQSSEKPVFPELRFSGFFSDVNLKGIGQVLESREGKNVVSAGDICYIGLNLREPVKIGDKFTTLNAQQDRITSEIVYGKRYNITGIIQVIDQNGPFFTAKVVEAFQEISKGDLIMPYNKEKMEAGATTK